MKKDGKLFSIILAVLLFLSLVNLSLGISLSSRISKLEEKNIIQIIEYETEETKERMTFESRKEENSENIRQTNEAVEYQTSAKKHSQTEEENHSSKPSSKDAYCYVTSSGKKYHKDGCSYLSKSKTKLTVSQAQASGYSPCSRCY